MEGGREKETRKVEDIVPTHAATPVERHTARRAALLFFSLSSHRRGNWGKKMPIDIWSFRHSRTKILLVKHLLQIYNCCLFIDSMSKPAERTESTTSAASERYDIFIHFNCEWTEVATTSHLPWIQWWYLHCICMVDAYAVLNGFHCSVTCFHFHCHLFCFFISMFSSKDGSIGSSPAGSVSETPKKSVRKSKKNTESRNKVYNSVLESVFGAVRSTLLKNLLSSFFIHSWMWCTWWTCTHCDGGTLWWTRYFKAVCCSGVLIPPALCCSLIFHGSQC